MGSSIETIEDIVKNDLCTGCGTCAAVCPSSLINLKKSIKKGIYLPVIEYEKCIHCHTCYDVCSGKGKDIDSCFSSKDQSIENLLIGNYKSCFVGHACEEIIRDCTTSGGIITSLLLFALEEKIIDGALVTRMNPTNPLEPEPFIARSPGDILSASRSKYCPVPANQGLREILEIDGRYAVVGLPCHLDGVRKAETSNPILRERIVLHLGIFCSHTVDFNGTDFLLEKLKVNKNEVEELAYRSKGWPGGLNIKLKNGHEMHIPHHLFWAHIFGRFFFTPRRCTLCCDGTAELSDISLGDAWLPELKREKRGESILVVRTEVGSNLILQAMEKGKIELQSVDGLKVIQSQRDQILFKKKNIVARQKLLRFFDQKIPNYDKACFLQPNIWDVITAVIPYLNISISNTAIGRLALRKLPTAVLSYYGNKFMQTLYNFSYGEYRSIKAEPLTLMPPKIHIINSFSPNLGDLSIVYTMIATLKERFPNAEFVISSTDPGITAKYVKNIKTVDSLSSRSSKIRHQLLNLIRLVRNWIWLCSYQRGISLFFLARRKTRQSLFEYLDADLILSCGGGYLNDNAGPAFLGCLLDIYLASIIKKPIMLYAQSIGPFRNNYLKYMTGYVLNQVNAINLRDEISTKFLEEIKIKTSLIIVTADVAHLLSSAGRSRAEAILTNEGLDITSDLITISVNPWTFPGSSDPSQKQQQYYETLTKLAKHIIETLNIYVLFIPMNLHGTPEKTAEIDDNISKIKNMAKRRARKVLKHIGRTSCSGEMDLIRHVVQNANSPERIKILEGDYDPSEIKAIIALSKIHIATRMHSSIYAASSYVPILGIAYEPKMVSFMNVLKQEQYLTDITNLNSEELIAKYDILWTNIDKERKIIATQSEMLKKKAASNAELVYDLLLKMEHIK